MLELVRTREGRLSEKRIPEKRVPGERAPEKLEKPVQVVELAHAARGRVIRFPGHALAAAAMLLVLLPLAARLVLVQDGTGEFGRGGLDRADVCSIEVDRLDEIAALVSATSEQRAALDAIRAEGERLKRKARTPEEARRIEKDVRARMRALLSEEQRSKLEASCSGLDRGRSR